MRLTVPRWFAAACAVLAACAESDRGSRGWRDQPLPSVTVAADTQRLELASVRSIPAPAVAFGALVRPDPSHASPVTARVTGILLSVRVAGPVRRRETLAVIGRDSAAVNRVIRLYAGHDGTWSPRRLATQLVWQGDTIGVIEKHEFWLAVGQVSDMEAGAIHSGDPARLAFGDDPRVTRPGRVEWVRSSGSYSVEVAVDFRAPAGCPVCVPPVTVVVTPAGAEDSIPAVPASAVVDLPGGRGVFVPAGGDRFQVRWVSTGPSVDGLVVVRDGLSPGTRVVVLGLESLVAAARDSLATAQKAPRR